MTSRDIVVEVHKGSDGESVRSVSTNRRGASGGQRGILIRVSSEGSDGESVRSVSTNRRVASGGQRGILIRVSSGSGDGEAVREVRDHGRNADKAVGRRQPRRAVADRARAGAGVKDGTRAAVGPDRTTEPKQPRRLLVRAPSSSEGSSSSARSVTWAHEGNVSGHTAQRLTPSAAAVRAPETGKQAAKRARTTFRSRPAQGFCGVLPQAMDVDTDEASSGVVRRNRQRVRKQRHGAVKPSFASSSSSQQSGASHTGSSKC